MFKKMKRKIALYVALPTFLCLLLICLTCFFMFRQIIFENFVSYSVRYVDQNAENATGYFRVAAESCHTLSESGEIATAIQGNDPGRISELLSGLTRSTSGAVGCSLYRADGTASYTASRGIPSSLSFEEMEELSGFSDFQSSVGTDAVLVRADNIPQSYSTIGSYSPANGLITLASKITDEQEQLCGYLLLDLDPAYVYRYFYYDSDTLVSDFQTFLTSDSGSTLSQGSADLEKYLSEAAAGEAQRSADGKYMIVSRPLYEAGIASVTLCPLAGFHRDIRYLGLVLTGLTLLLTFLSWLLGIGLSRSIAKPLRTLTERMDRSPGERQ